MERLEGRIDRNVQTMNQHETRITRVEDAVAEIRAKLKDLEHPPRWVQTGLLLALVLKEILWPLIQAMGR